MTKKKWFLLEEKLPKRGELVKLRGSTDGKIKYDYGYIIGEFLFYTYTHDLSLSAWRSLTPEEKKKVNKKF